MKRFTKGIHASRTHLFSTAGFTLIEVVIALAILGIGLMVIMELFLRRTPAGKNLRGVYEGNEFCPHENGGDNLTTED